MRTHTHTHTHACTLQVCDVIDRILASPLAEQLKDLNLVSCVCWCHYSLAAIIIIVYFFCRILKLQNVLSSKRFNVKFLLCKELIFFSIDVIDNLLVFCDI